MQNVARDGGRDESNVLLLVTTTEREQVTFTVTTTFGKTSHTASYGTSTSVTFPADSVYVTNERQRDRYILVQAEEGKTISVYGVNDEYRSTDGFVALPCDGMSVGTPFKRYEYSIVSAKLEATVDNPQTFSEFLVIPCEDDTRVEIIPSQLVTVNANDFGTTQFGPNAHSKSGVWERLGQYPSAGSTLLVTNSVDLTGTIVRSSKPIVVFSGHQCAQVPTGQTACDHLVEQIPPHTTWGYTFLLNPLAARESGDIYRVATVYDDTEVTVTCVDEGGTNAQTEVLGTLNRAQTNNWLEYVTQDPNRPPCITPFIRKFCSLQATNPVLVAQYSQGYRVDTQCTRESVASELGDPFMSIIPPIVQYLNDYTITAITGEAGSFPTRYVSISVYKTFFQPSRILMDGVPVEPDSSKWNRIYCSEREVCGYGIYKEISLGDHTIHHESENAAISVETYGYQQQNSYGFPAGMELEPLSGMFDSMYCLCYLSMCNTTLVRGSNNY